MEITADNLAQACEIAMRSADDEHNWKDTLVSSSHWIECIDYGKYPVPEEFSAAAIRSGGAVLIAYRLRDALATLIEACERDRGTLNAIGRDVDQAKVVLADIPTQLGTDPYIQLHRRIVCLATAGARPYGLCAPLALTKMP